MNSKKLAIAVVLLAACGTKQENEPATTVDTVAVSTPSPAPSPEPAPAPAEPDTAWVVSLNRAGAFEPGMSLADARAQIPNFEAPAKPTECDYANVGGADKLSFLIVENKVARIDVKTTDVPTDKGIRVGDSEEKVKAAYTGVIVQPHKYTDGHYLVVTNPSDSKVALIFETDGKKVTRYRLGTQPVVGWVEGCS